MKELTKQIESAVKNTLSILKLKCTVIVTPSTISFEDIDSRYNAEKIEKAFLAGSMKSLGVCDMEEIQMGQGYSLTISY